MLGNSKDDFRLALENTLKKYQNSIAIILFVLGLAFRWFATTKQEMVWLIIGDLGTFLSGVIAIEFIYERFVKTEERRIFLNDLRAIHGSPVLFLPEKRGHLSREYYIPKSEVAKNVDIIALSLRMFNEEYSTEDLIRWVVRDGKNIRILVLSPNSTSAVLRGREEMISLPEKIKSEIERLRNLHRLFEAELKRTRKCKGSIEVRSYDGVPYFAYFRADHEIVVGFYFSHQEGNQSECLLVKETTDSLSKDFYNNLRNHFESIWEGKSEQPGVERIILKVKPDGAYFIS